MTTNNAKDPDIWTRALSCLSDPIEGLYRASAMRGLYDWLWFADVRHYEWLSVSELDHAARAAEFFLGSNHTHQPDAEAAREYLRWIARMDARDAQEHRLNVACAIGAAVALLLALAGAWGWL